MTNVIRKIEPSDMPTIAMWHIARDQKPLIETCYPPTGYILEGVAAAWLTKTDAGIALIENVVTNTEIVPEEREIGLTHIINFLSKIAKDEGFKYLLGFSRIPKIGFYAKAIGGFPIAEVTLYGKEL